MGRPILKVDLENFEQVMRVLQEAFPELLKDFDRLLGDWAYRIRRRMRRSARRFRKTGELEKAIAYFRREFLDWYIESRSPHAFALEFGKKKQRIGRGPRKGEIVDVKFPAQPYFFPEVEKFKRLVPARLRRFLTGEKHRWEVR